MLLQIRRPASQAVLAIWRNVKGCQQQACWPAAASKSFLMSLYLPSGTPKACSTKRVSGFRTAKDGRLLEPAGGKPDTRKLVKLRTDATENKLPTRHHACQASGIQHRNRTAGKAQGLLEAIVSCTRARRPSSRANAPLQLRCMSSESLSVYSSLLASASSLCLGREAARRSS